MELWTLKHKKTKNIIKINKITLDELYPVQWFFIENNNSPYWFVDSFEKVQKVLTDNINPIEHINYETPTCEYIDLNNYEITKFKNE